MLRCYEMIKINEFFFTDHEFDTPEQYERWKPDDLYDFNEWIRVLVGTDKKEGGSWFYVQVCSNDAKARIKDDKYLYTTYYWQGVDALIDELEAYLNKLINEHNGVPDYEKLSSYWQWSP